MKKNNNVYVKKTLEIDKDLYHEIKIKVVTDGKTFKEFIDCLLRTYLRSVS